MKHVLPAAIVLVLLAVGVGAAARFSTLATQGATVKLAQADKTSAPAAGGPVTVSTSDQLMSAVKRAKGGDTILLKPGTYSGLKFEDLRYPSTVTIASADVNNRAVLTNFDMLKCGGMTFQDLDMWANVFPAYNAWKVRNSDNIAFKRVRFHGSLDGNPQNDQWGINFAETTNVSVTDSEFIELGIGLQISKSTGFLFARNYVHFLQTDGLELNEVHDVQILNNFITDFHPVKGDHPDAIQFWTDNVGPSSNVLVSGNVLTRGNGTMGQQGVFGDDLHEVGYSDFRVTDNLLIGTGYNGIAFSGSPPNKIKNFVITGNELWSYDNDALQTWIRLEKADGALISGNKTFTMVLPEGSNTRVTLKDNKNNQPIGARNADRPLKDWLARHPDMNWVGAIVLGSPSAGTSSPKR